MVFSGAMEVRSEGIQVRSDKLPAPVIPRTRLQVWFVRVCSSILLWTFLVQLVAFGKLWHPLFISNITNRISQVTGIPLSLHVEESIQSTPLLPASEFLKLNPYFFVVFDRSNELCIITFVLNFRALRKGISRGVNMIPVLIGLS